MALAHTVTDGIAEVVMDNPPVNALTVAGWFELADLVRALGADPAVRVVVLTAEGRGFNAGVDIKEMQTTEGYTALVGANRGCYAAFAAVYECEVPVIAAVHGYCLGGGIGLAGNADIIVAADDATFGLPEVDRGALGAATHLARLVPQHKMRAMVYTATTATAQELHHYGSVLKVVPRAELRDAMTIGIGGWGSRRKPMALIREILRSPVRDLTVVSYGGPDVGLLCAAGKARKVVFAFVSLDSIPLEPHFRNARQAGAVDTLELDEGMFLLGLQAAAWRVPFLPTRVGLGSDVLEKQPEIRTVTSPYDDGEELVAMPALHLDVALVHQNRADARGNAQFLGPDPYFDDLMCQAADRAFVTCERIVDTADLAKEGSHHTLRISRLWTDGVVETPNGAHFTSCVPDYERDEVFQRDYAASAKSPEAWDERRGAWLDLDEDGYQQGLAGRQQARATRP